MKCKNFEASYLKTTQDADRTLTFFYGNYTVGLYDNNAEFYSLGKEPT